MKSDQGSRPNSRASAVRVVRSSGSNTDTRFGLSAPRVGGATRGSRHLWSDPVDCAAPTGRVRGGQDGRTRDTPILEPSDPAAAVATKPQVTTPDAFFGSAQVGGSRAPAWRHQVVVA